MCDFKIIILHVFKAFNKMYVSNDHLTNYKNTTNIINYKSLFTL